MSNYLDRLEAARKPSHVWEGLMQNAAKKADEAGRSDKPWTLGNLRMYQDLEGKFWLYAKLAREAEQANIGNDLR